jgi:hypothetical protein
MRDIGCLVVSCAILLTMGGCGGSNDSGTTSQNNPLFRLRPSTTPEPVHLEITDPLTIVDAEVLLQSGDARWATGIIRRGDGSFNAPWQWHLDPATIKFAEITIEACQAAPPYIEQTLDYWLAFGRVCIGGSIDARER